MCYEIEIGDLHGLFSRGFYRPPAVISGNSPISNYLKKNNYQTPNLIMISGRFELAFYRACILLQIRSEMYEITFIFSSIA